MSWVNLYQPFELIASQMCCGQKAFKPHIPDFLQFGLQKGDYRIVYVSGAIKSHNKLHLNNILQKNFDFTCIKKFDQENIDLTGHYIENGLNTWIKDTSPYYQIEKDDTYYNVTLNQDFICSGKLYDCCSTICSNITQCKSKCNVDKLQILSNVKYFNINNKNNIFKITTTSEYQYKWNKLYDIKYHLNQLYNMNYSYFPNLYYDVFQCQYGTLPGFTPVGSNTIEYAEYLANGQKLPTEIYSLLSTYIQPLEFSLNNTTILSFWYTDDCAPCVEGSITYQLQKWDDYSDRVVNALGVCSFNINTLFSQSPEYYCLNRNDTIKLKQKTIQYVNLNNNKIDYLLNLQQYNTFGLGNNVKNSSAINMDLSYINDYTNAYCDYYWVIKKIKPISKFNLLSNIILDNDNSSKNIILTEGVYTIISNNDVYLHGSIIINDTQQTFDLQTLTQQYVFNIQHPTDVVFNVNCYLYSGIITKDQLLQKVEQNKYTKKYDIDIDENLTKEKEQLISDLTIINNSFYLYISPEKDFIQIKSNINQNEIYINYNFLIGPFNSLKLAQQQVKQYAILNGLIYEKINENLYAIGQE